MIINFFEKNQNQFVANWILRKNDYHLFLYIYICFIRVRLETNKAATAQ